jgi:hypothetical protein
VKQENGTWWKRYNYELYEIFNETNIVNYIKVKRPTLKKIFNTKPDGPRSVGRPKLRWEDGVDQDNENIRDQELEENRPQQRRMGKAS